jgi:hypothetical protein
MDTLPPPAGDNELPKCQMGQFIEPTIEKKLGLRTAFFTDSEKNVTELVISRNEENGNDVDALDEHEANRLVNINTGEYIFRSPRRLALDVYLMLT